MKSIASALLIAAVLCGCGAPNPGGESGPNSPECKGLTLEAGRSGVLLGVGRWSRPVTDRAGYTLRGRLLVFDKPHFSLSGMEFRGSCPVYLELQNLSSRRDRDVAVYFALADGLECDLRDAHGKPCRPNNDNTALSSLLAYGYFWTRQYWAAVPIDGSVRLRAGPSLSSSSPNLDGLHIEMSRGPSWYAPEGDTNRYFLSGTFSPPTDHPSPPDAHAWQGRLDLPAVELRVPKP